MVDPVGPSSSVPNISQSSRVTQRQNEERSADVRSSKDSVVLSEEAISLSEAEVLSKQIGQSLANDSDAVLSSDVERLNSLI